MPPDDRKRPLPEAEKKRLGRAAFAILSTGLVSLVAIAALLIWHLVRRGRLVRDSLGPPRRISLPDPEDLRRDDRPSA